MIQTNWPYPLEWQEEITIQSDVLVLGGGIAGCMAAISAARQGMKVVLVEKGATKRSGAGGSGCDHWESAATNPCSKVTPEELTTAMLKDNAGYNNGISHYIECREGYDRLLDLEKMGAKIRDTEDEFVGATFRDEATKFMFAYDYENKFTFRIWGTTFKPAMYAELKRLGVQIVDRVMVTSLLTENGEIGGSCIGATGIHTRTGKFYVFQSKSSIMCMSRPARVWLFSPAYPGLSEFRPTQCIGDGHAMGYRAGATFTMMEKSVGAQFSAAGRSFPPYGAGNNHNTWYPVSLIDATGKEIPYANRDGKELDSFEERTKPAQNQHFFMKGGSIEEGHYDIQGPETLSVDEMVSRGYKLPFYADMTTLPPLERKVIWGMMVGEEGKTRVPIYENYTQAGFDPARDVLQCYGAGWTSAQFMSNERQLFGLPGGFLNDWTLSSTLKGLYVAGDALYASNCYGHAAATGAYAGRHASVYAKKQAVVEMNRQQVEEEKMRIHGYLQPKGGQAIGWKELNMAIAKIMQRACGEVKNDDLLLKGIEELNTLEAKAKARGFAYNPHELTRLLEVMDILTVSKMIVEASFARKKSCKALEFIRQEMITADQDKNLTVEMDENHLLTVRLESVEDSGVMGNAIKTVIGQLPLDFFGDLKKEYEKVNPEYCQEVAYVRNAH